MTTANGIDISSWQHPGGALIDWSEVVTSGKQFVMVKCSQGTNYRSPFFKADVEAAKAGGLLVGAYHYAMPSQNTAQAEAAYALASVANVPLDLGLALDLEDLGSMQLHDAAQWAQDFMAAIVEGGVETALYVDQNTLNGMVGAPWVYRLWIADQSGTYVGAPWMRQGVSEAVTGISGTVDSDVLSNIRGANPGPSGPPALPPGPPVTTVTPIQPEPIPGPVVAPPSPQEDDVQVPTLSVTDPGPDAVSVPVRAVQAIIVYDGGITVGPSGVDGKFGPDTEQAVKTFQGLHGLTQDGIVGPLTWGVLING